MPAAQAPNSPEAQPESNFVRLHITPFRPDLLKVYLAPSILPSARNISYHTVATFPEKGFGYVELPEAEAQKIKKKLNGTTLRGSKVRIEMAKPEKRKAREEAEAAKEAEEAERPSKRAKKDKKDKKEKKERKKKEQGVLEGVELPEDRKVKRGWTEPATKPKKHKKDKKDKKDQSDKEATKERKPSKYTKDPELLFKAKLTPVAATEVAHKDKKKDKKEKKEKNKSKSTDFIVHEFEKNVKTPSFLKQPEVKLSTKPAVDYVNGQGWVDEDGVVVEPETGKAKARRALELVDAPSEAQRAWIDGTSKPSSSEPKGAKDQKKRKATPPPSSSESEDDESSVVSSSSEDEDSSESESELESEESEAESPASSPASAAKSRKTQPAPKPAASAEKEVHPLEALFKRSAPTDVATTTPTKKLLPIDTSFSFFDNNNTNDDAMDVDDSKPSTEEPPTTPFTQRDIEWRGLRSAAPTPDTAAIGRRFSFDWRKNSQEVDDDEDMGDVDEDAEHRLTLNTRANASKLAGVAEEDGDEDGTTTAGGGEDKPESEFRKWFWENRGDLNRAWKKRRRDALKAKRHSENKKMTGGRRVV